MNIGFRFGDKPLQLTVPDGRLIAAQPVPPKEVAPPVAELLRQAVREPVRFPALQRALTPDDSIALVVGGGIAEADGLIPPLLEEIIAAGIARERVSVVLPPGPAGAVTYAGLHSIRHRPVDRSGLSYLASTKAGRRVYLNRTVAEADQAIVLAEVRYDMAGEPTGGPAALFPLLGDTAARDAMAKASAEVVRAEAGEVAWLLGAPFFLHVIRGPGGTVAEVVGGVADSYDDAVRRLDALWTVPVRRRADVVVATVIGEPELITVDDTAAALANAGRVTAPGGTIVLLTGAGPTPGEAFESIRQADSPADALKRLKSHESADTAAARLWLRAVRDFRVLVFGDWPGPLIEDWFATPLQTGSQLQQVVDTGGQCLVLQDAHRTRTVLESP